MIEVVVRNKMEEDKHQCRSCSVSCSTKWNLKRHQVHCPGPQAEQVVGAPPQQPAKAPVVHQCAACQRSFSSKQRLQSHQQHSVTACLGRTLPSTGSLVCELCGKEWSRNQVTAWRQHVQHPPCHDGYDCPLCQCRVRFPREPEGHVCVECHALADQLSSPSWMVPLYIHPRWRLWTTTY